MQFDKMMEMRREKNEIELNHSSSSKSSSLQSADKLNSSSSNDANSPRNRAKSSKPRLGQHHTSNHPSTARPKTSIHSRDLFIDKKLVSDEIRGEEAEDNKIKIRNRENKAEDDKNESETTNDNNTMNKENRKNRCRSAAPHLLNAKAGIVYATKPRWLLDEPLHVDDIPEIREAVHSYYEEMKAAAARQRRARCDEWNRLLAVSAVRTTSPRRRRKNPASPRRKRMSSAKASFYSALQCYLPAHDKVKASSLDISSKSSFSPLKNNKLTVQNN